jgi:hypothetical protein
VQEQIDRLLALPPKHLLNGPPAQRDPAKLQGRAEAAVSQPLQNR